LSSEPHLRDDAFFPATTRAFWQPLSGGVMIETGGSLGLVQTDAGLP
jgi:hypothetical protein